MGWLSGWAKRVKLTADGGVIDADLTDFPSLLYISSSSGKNAKNLTFVFTEVGANSKKIAVTKADGTTQCYVEIERWDSANNKAWLFVKNPTLADAGEDYYLYFDNTHADNTTYVGDVGSTPAKAVWDSNFKMVQHLKDNTTSTTLDSTSNANNGTKPSANNPLEVDAKIGKGQDFSSDYITLPNSIIPSGNFSVEVWLNPDAVTYSRCVELRYNSKCIIFSPGPTTTGYLDVYDGTWRTNLTTIAAGSWQYFVYTWDGSTARLYKNGEFVTSWSAAPPSETLANKLGSDWQNTNLYDGKMDEVRASSTNRSAAWIKASYNSGNDSLWTWGDMETPEISLEESFSISDGLLKTGQTTISEAFSLSDLATKQLSTTRSEAFGLSDGITKQFTTTREEAFSLTDSFTRKLTRVIEESFGITDELGKAATIFVTLLETVGITDKLLGVDSLPVKMGMAVVKLIRRR